jgi:hypothetical protein
MLEVIRDIAIIVLAVETIVVGLALLFLLWQSWKLVGLARRHLDRLAGSAHDILGTVKETARSTADTARTAKGTADFVGDRAALPIIEFYSAVAGASRFARALFGSRRNPGGGNNK